MRYAFDIDNTLVSTVGNDYASSTPIQHRIDRVNRLFDEGHTIYLFTARGMASGRDYYELTLKQMQEFGVKHHRIIMGKPDVDLFVDDKAISVQEWDFTHSISESPVIWTNGCYDILHVGHLRLFQHCRDLAKSCGGRFIIGIDSDSRVREMKGVDRPINNQLDRAEVLRSIKGVDGVYIYSTAEELDDMIRVLAPNVVVVGDDYKDKSVIGSQHAKSVEFFSKIQGYSTTEIVNRLRQ